LLMGLLRILGTAGLTAATVLAVGSAATAEGASEGQAACAADAKQRCGSVKPGGARVLECLARERDHLSTGCKEEIEPIASRVIAWRDACGADIDAKCATQRLGHGLGECLERQHRTLAPSCRARISTVQTFVTFACSSQVESLCKGTEPGDGRYLACIDEKRSQLTSPCSGVWSWYERRYRADCARDVREHCGGATRYDRSYPCLQAHQRELSAACQRVVAPPVPEASGSAANLGEGPFAGYYASNWGLVTCKQAAGKARVDCSYTYDSGRLTCVANNNTLVCGWREGPTKGRATIVRDKGGDMTGTWGHGQRATGGGSWMFAKLK
jgi:hypothetical protein